MNAGAGNQKGLSGPQPLQECYKCITVHSIHFFILTHASEGNQGKKKKVKKKNSNIFGLITKINGGEVVFFYSKLTIFYTLKEDNKIPQKDSRETWCINKVQTIRRPTLEVNDFISSGISPFITNII